MDPVLFSSATAGGGVRCFSVFVLFCFVLF